LFALTHEPKFYSQHPTHEADMLVMKGILDTKTAEVEAYYASISHLEGSKFVAAVYDFDSASHDILLGFSDDVAATATEYIISHMPTQDQNTLFIAWGLYS